MFDRLGALDDAPSEQQSIDRPEHRVLAREAAAESMVLLKNDDAMLPIDPSSITTLAVVGPNAEQARIMGGGSASFTPHYRVPPLDALQERVGAHVKIVYEQGCDIERTVPPIVADFDIVVDDGAERAQRRDGRLIWLGGLPGGGTAFRATASLVPKTAGPHVLSLVQLGPTRVLLDGALVLDGVTNPPPRGRELFAMGSEPIEATVELDTSPHELVVEYTGGTSGPLEGVQVGCRALPPADLMDRAVAAAAGADAAIVVVGTNDDWESEGHDREFMELPGDQAELIRRVAAANPRTVVAVNAASPGDDGLGRRGARGARDVVRRPGDGERAGRRAVRRERTERTAAHHVPGPARAQPVVRQLPR